MSGPGRTDETSAGGIVYRLEHGRALYLLIRDSYQNWGFPKGHLEDGERPEDAALREVAEETGLTDLAVRAPIDTIDWYFRFHGRVVHKTCHFFLMEATQSTTSPARAEGITACRWIEFDEGESLVSYTNARDVLRRANDLVGSFTTSA
jgi:8-oxo-dGTP pyrophosphatase MutT (NUDIX family)